MKRFIKAIIRRPLLSLTLCWAFLCLMIAKGWTGAGRFFLDRLLFREADALCDSKPVSFRARVLNTEQKEKGFWSVMIVEDGQYKGYRAEGYLPREVIPGSRAVVSGRLRRPEEAGNPGEFDFLRYYSIRKTAFLLETDRLGAVYERSSLRGTLYRIRRGLSAQVERALPAQQAGTVSTILFGERAKTDEEIKTLFQEAGIAHILAVSGLHITLFFSMAAALLKKLLPMRPASLLASLLMWAYVLLTGAQASTLRAALMLSLRILASLCYREEDPAVTLSFAALIILLVQPLYICDPGFCLSFASVLGLRYLTPLLERCFFIPRRIRLLLCPSFAAFLAALPISLRTFCGFSPYTPFLNLLVVPLVSVVFLAGLLGAAAGFLSLSLSEFCFGSVYYILRFYELLCRLAQRLPGFFLLTGAPGSLWMAAYFALMIFACRLTALSADQRKTRLRKCRWIIAGLSVCVLLFRLPKTEAYFLNIGQGDCLYLQWKGRHYLVDAGPSYDSVLEPFLKYKGVRSIEGFFLTHPDEDHREGLERLLGNERITIRHLYLADTDIQRTEEREQLVSLARSRQISVIFWQQGDRLRRGREEIVCLSPVKSEKYDSVNESSMVLWCKLKAMNLLLTGDIEAGTEAELVRRGLIPRVSVLKAAHHGSSGSSSEAFLQAARPLYTVISADHSVYGHPHEETLKRLQKAASTVLITEYAGCIRIYRLFGHIRVKPFLKGDSSP